MRASAAQPPSRARGLGWIYLIGGGTYPLWRLLAPEHALDPVWVWWALGGLFVAAGAVGMSRREAQPTPLLYLPSFAVAIHLHALLVANPNESFYALAATLNVVTTLLAMTSAGALLAYSLIVLGAGAVWLLRDGGSGAMLYWVAIAWVLALAHRRMSGQRLVDELTASHRSELEQRLAQERSQRIQLQEELVLAQRMESIGRLSGALAHEFNNQLMAVRIHAELMEKEAPPSLRPDLQRIKDCIQQAAELTTQLVQFLRPHKVRDGSVDLNALLQEQLPMLRHLMGERTTVVCPPYEPSWVTVSRERAEQVLLNLALNARDAMPEGGTFTLTLRRHGIGEVELPPHLDVSEPDEFVLLAVTDTGVGIDAETRSRIFDPYFTTKGEHGRTGLGLFTVYGIVTESGGHVRVVSEPGSGARFEIYWPSGEEAKAAPEPPPRAPAPALQARVLLVEDQTELRRGLVRWLEGSGHRVIEAESAEQALARLASGPHEVDVVATDVVLSGMDGIELIERLRARDPGVRAVAFSGHLDHLSRTGRVLPEGVPLLDKPFDPQQLDHVIAELLGGEAPRDGRLDP